jgi:hypothetical protein
MRSFGLRVDGSLPQHITCLLARCKNAAYMYAALSDILNQIFGFEDWGGIGST